MRFTLTAVTGLVLLAACGSDDEYAAAVEDLKPVYCYRSLAGVECFNEPFHRDSARLVNYYGPRPDVYEAPAKVPAPPLAAPARVDYWVKDPEPIPTPKVYLRDLASAPPSIPVDRERASQGN